MVETAKDGAMQIKAGKLRLFSNGAWHDFGPMFVAADMRKLARPVNGRVSAYAPHLLKMAVILEREGLFGSASVRERLESFFGAREIWMRHNTRVWHNWLGQIWQFRSCTGKKDAPVTREQNRNFRGNFEKVFKGNA